MRYKSTRGESPEVTFSEVLLGGLAPDGGLYMPEAFPQFSIQEIQSWSELSFDQLASKILYPFVKEEIDEDEAIAYNSLLNNSADNGFPSSQPSLLNNVYQPAPVVRLGVPPNRYTEIAQQAQRQLSKLPIPSSMSK